MFSKDQMLVLTHGRSSCVEKLLTCAWKIHKKRFSVLVTEADAGPPWTSSDEWGTRPSPFFLSLGPEGPLETLFYEVPLFRLSLVSCLAVAEQSLVRGASLRLRNSCAASAAVFRQ